MNRRIIRRSFSLADRSRPPGSRARDQVRTALGLAIGLLLCVGSVAQAGEGSRVVPRGGKVAGEGYAHWLLVKGRLFFSSPPSGPKACDTQHAQGGTVAFLFGGFTDGKTVCDEPAGRPIYVAGVSNECSTLPGDHNGFGTSDSQLEVCSRAGFEGLSGMAAVDGAPVTNYGELIAGTATFEFHLMKENLFGLKPQSGRSAGYGEGLLLRGLSAGTHIIRVTSSTSGGGTHVVEYALRVH